MAQETKIEWCDATFNPWIGCTKVSPACAHCYAENSTRARVLRAGGNETWGKGATRSRTSPTNWREPLKWNVESEAKGIAAACCHGQYRRPRVFCASLADWLDDEVPIEWFVNLLETIHATPFLDWLLLSKRPENWRSRMDAAFQFGELKSDRHFAFIHWLGIWSQTESEHAVAPDNVWLGTTVENQEMAEKRIPELLSIPAKIRFVSCEPMLGPVDLRRIGDDDGNTLDALTGDLGVDGRGHTGPREAHVNWVICGGESGPKARPMHPDWARSLRDQSQAAGVPFLFKQWGEWLPYGQGHSYMDNFKECRLVGNGPGATGVPSYLVGKKPAGRLLDGREWNEFPTL